MDSYTFSYKNSDQAAIDKFLKDLVGNLDQSNLALPDPDLLQYYQNYRDRVLWIDEEIDASTLDVVTKLMAWNEQDKGLAPSERKPIRIFFNSPGGSLDVEAILSSIIQLSKTPVYGIALGMVASAASLVYLSCHKRFALPGAYFIFHKGSCSNIGGNYNEVQALMEDYRMQVEKMEKFYIEHTKYPEEIVKEKIRSDWYIYVDEAVEFGIVDQVVDDLDMLG